MPFYLDHITGYVDAFRPLFVGPFVLVSDVEHDSSHFDLCINNFVPCLFGEYPGRYRHLAS